MHPRVSEANLDGNDFLSDEESHEPHADNEKDKADAYGREIVYL